MSVLYVTSLRPGEGRTAFSAGLAHLLRQQGRRSTLFKPISLSHAAAATSPDADAAFFARLEGAPLPTHWPVAVDPAQASRGLPLAAKEQVTYTFQEVARQTPDVIVEGPPLSTGSGEPLGITSDLAEALDARAVVVARYSTALTAQDVIKPAQALGERLLGVVLNRVLRYRNHDAQTRLIAPLRQQGIPVLAALAEERCLLGVTVGQIARHLGGEFLMGEDKQDWLVDHWMIGGLVLDWGIRYFEQSETKGVIVRGDRPDIQMAAVHTPTRCLVLTGGRRPIQYVEHEAKEEEIPLVLVQSDTLTTARALESLFQEVTVHHPEKVECFARMLGQALVLSPTALFAP